ncbi:MAG: hypothetical protein H7Z42_07275 [Roseiflexaceae bacterium]|nr:hypothetical protein [Roseiflexaceae bacterium]
MSEKQNEQQDRIDSTIDALDGDLTAIKPENALDVISTWRRSLSHSSNPELKEISDGLGELKDALSAGTLDGKQIGGILKTLGKQTSAAAKDADEAYTDGLTRLGKTLSKAGNALG